MRLKDICRLAVLLPAFLAGMPLTAQVVQESDPETGLRSWRFTAGNLAVELIQRLPDQTRGFFLARGFPAEIADEIAANCIFQTIIRNTGEQDGDATIGVDLAQWRVIQAGREQGIRLKEPWSASWPDEAVAGASRLAFRWALFPTRQEFLRDDYNWGMTAFGLPPGTVFDLVLAWQEAGKVHSARLEGIECAPDVERLR